jgi:hypothetical protein
MRLLVVTLVLAPSFAAGGNDSIVTLGIGTHTLVSRSSAATSEGSASTSVGQGLSARLRFLYVLGAELSYDLVGTRSQAEVNVPAPTFKLSGLLYLIPHARFSLFLAGGLGATSIGDLLSTDGSTSSYHGGMGMEVGITRHVVISADFRVNLPAYSQAVERAKREAFQKGDLPSPSAYYNFDSWQVSVGVRYYL